MLQKGLFTKLTSPCSGRFLAGVSSPVWSHLRRLFAGALAMVDEK